LYRIRNQSEKGIKVNKWHLNKTGRNNMTIGGFIDELLKYKSEFNKTDVKDQNIN
jgi:hypothetical protein